MPEMRNGDERLQVRRQEEAAAVSEDVKFEFISEPPPDWAWSEAVKQLLGMPPERLAAFCAALEANENCTSWSAWPLVAEEHKK